MMGQISSGRRSCAHGKIGRRSDSSLPHFGHGRRRSGLAVLVEPKEWGNLGSVTLRFSSRVQEPEPEYHTWGNTIGPLDPELEIPALPRDRVSSTSYYGFATDLPPSMSCAREGGMCSVKKREAGLRASRRWPGSGSSC